MRQKHILNSRDTIARKESRSSGPVVRAFSILKCVSEGTYALSDISKKCNLSHSTTYGLLQKLKRSHAVIHDPVTHHYYIGQLIPQLASNLIFAHQYLIACSLEEMKDLAAYTRVTITLDILVGFKAFRISMIHGSHRLRVTDAEDEPNIKETFLSAPGKVLYSQLSEEKLRKMSKFLKPRSTFGDIMADVKQVNRQGYSFSSGVRIQGVSCISIPIYSYNLPAALNVIGPDASIKPNIKSFVDKAIKTAANISKNIKVKLEE